MDTNETANRPIYCEDSTSEIGIARYRTVYELCPLACLTTSYTSRSSTARVCELPSRPEVAVCAASATPYGYSL